MKPHVPEDIASPADLRALQRLMASTVMRPLTDDYDMREDWADGISASEVAEQFIKPNDRLTSFERLEIYNRQYWFRIIDCFYDDFPGMRTVLGDTKFEKFTRAYLARYPSRSFTLRNLGCHLEEFVRAEPQWTTPHEELALDMARFEWAQVIAFDSEARPPVNVDDLLDKNPDALRLGLQPHLTLLELNYAVDDLSLALKKEDVLDNSASNAVSLTRTKHRRKRIPKPKRGRVYVAVHRYDNALYYKRIEKEACLLLHALQRGATLEEACQEVLADDTQVPDTWISKITDWFRVWAELGWFCAAD
jgi:hypothetical protein